METLKQLYADPKKVIVLKKSKSTFLLKSFFTQDKYCNLTGQDDYFKDLARGIYRQGSKDGDSARAWKFIFKHLFFSKEIFSKMERKSNKRVSVLDVGCGAGYIKTVLESNIRGWEEIIYCGVDLRRSILIKAMSDDRSQPGCSRGKMISAYLWHDVTRPFPLKSDSFDFVVCSQLIKYLAKSSVNTLFSEIFRLLKRNGVLLLSNGLMFNKKIDLTMAEPKTKNRKENYWTTDELVDILKRSKFKKISVYGGETRLKYLLKGMKKDDKILLDKFRHIFPDEIVESIFGFFYPELSGVKIFVAHK